MRFWKQKRVWIPFMILIFIYLNNSSLVATKPKGDPLLLAHRGLAQTFSMDNLTDETCTAEQMYPPEHSFLENTIPSMKAAVHSGADVVELDIHPTKDGKFAVFHDWTLDCRTNGTGVTREHTMKELKKLDIGYDYTADDGKSFPFRGKGVGLMPSLDEVIKQFPNQQFLFHVKSNDALEGKLLASYLSNFPTEKRINWSIYGGDEPIQILQQQLPQMRVMSKATMKDCLIPYVAISWTGYIPESCAQTQLHIPEKIALFLWGWPNRFLERMVRHDTRVIVVAGGGGASEGFDSVQDLKRLPADFSGGIWTNRIDLIGAALQRKQSQK